MADAFMKYFDAISRLKVEYQQLIELFYPARQKDFSPFCAVVDDFHHSTVFKRPTSNETVIWSGQNAHGIPCYPIKPLHRDVIGAWTGPFGGLSCIQLDGDEPSQHAPAADIADWKCPLPEADGLSLSLYDHIAAGSIDRHGDPNADVFAVVARLNNAILIVADGCNWGRKPRQAARCAANGSVQHLNRMLFGSCTTQDVVQVIRDSFDSAQKSIIENGGTTTTLCVGVVCELAKPKGEHRWGLCVVSVGDSPCFVWQSKNRQVLEVTSASHEGQVRDMRDSGGCLGANVGEEPDLSNLTCCFALLAEGDIVFLTSDGISDNFDPVTLLEGVGQPTTATHNEPLPPMALPMLTPHERQVALLANMTRVILGARSQDQPVHASDVKEAIIVHVTEVTDRLRTYMESSLKDVDNPGLTTSERRTREFEFKKNAKTMSGKLDHATLVLYEICKSKKDRNT